MEDGGGPSRASLSSVLDPLSSIRSSMPDPLPSSQSAGSDATGTDPPRTPPPPRRRWRRRALWLASGLLALLVTGEIVARYGLGLGDPPLSVADPQIEYLFKPNQTCRRFGHRIHYNAY